MSNRTIDFERAALYEQAWSQPLTKVALKYGVTPAEVKKVAQALMVPLPPSGHWTKGEHGKNPEAPPLAEFNGATTHSLTKWVNDEAEEVARRLGAEQEKIVKTVAPLPEMRTALADCLPVIKRMAGRLKKGYMDTRGWPAIRGMGQFELSVAPPNQVRALLTMDRIIRHCQKAGFKLVSDDAQRDSATLVVDDIAFTLRIFESGRREEREFTAQEKAEMKAYPNRYHYLPNRWVFHPTNQLRLEVHNPMSSRLELTI